MKNTIILLFSLLFYSSLFADNHLLVCENKVIHLISKEKISYLQLGNHSLVLAEIVPQHPNLVRIKALKEFEGESSISLVSDGKLYSFCLSYGESNEISYQLESFSFKKADLYLGNLMPEQSLKKISRDILSKQKKHVRNRKSDQDGIVLQLRNIYLSDDVLFFELEISNKTNMGYDVEGFHWWIDDKKRLKASNTQEYRILPQYQYYQLKYIPAKTKVREIFVFPKFTIPDKRVLRIEVLEQALGNTGRKLSVELKNKDIRRAENL